ncbi:hypothetical protein FB451DRAFT_1176984 [Mycena latifolia]|nr:hypothetical protein FB451DRAFT_1176984 [Mycena latifolia]
MQRERPSKRKKPRKIREHTENPMHGISRSVPTPSHPSPSVLYAPSANIAPVRCARCAAYSINTRGAGIRWCIEACALAILSAKSTGGAGYRMPESLSTFCRIVSLTAANMSQGDTWMPRIHPSYKPAVRHLRHTVFHTFGSTLIDETDEEGMQRTAGPWSFPPAYSENLEVTPQRDLRQLALEHVDLVLEEDHARAEEPVRVDRSLVTDSKRLEGRIRVGHHYRAGGFLTCRALYQFGRQLAAQPGMVKVAPWRHHWHQLAPPKFQLASLLSHWRRAANALAPPIHKSIIN